MKKIKITKEENCRTVTCAKCEFGEFIRDNDYCNEDIKGKTIYICDEGERVIPIDEVIEAIDWVNDNYDYDWSHSFMLEKIICRLEEKYNVQE